MRDDDPRHHARDRVPSSWDDRSNHDLPDYDPDGALDRCLLWAFLGCLGLLLTGAIVGLIVFRLIRT